MSKFTFTMIVFTLFTSLSLQAQEDQEVSIDNPPNGFQERMLTRLIPINNLVQNRFSNNRAFIKGDHDYFVDRFDLEFSLSLSGGIKLFSLEKRKSFELVWERGQGQDFDFPQHTVDTNIIIDTDERSNFRKMFNAVLALMSESKFSQKQIEKVKKRLYKDATQITKLADNLASFPEYKNWRINRFFKNYYFSFKSGIVYAGAEYDRRLRFRFLIPQIYKKDEDTDKNRVHKKLRRYITKFEDVRLHDTPYNRYKLKRIWMVHALNAYFDLGFIGIGKGRGIQIEYLYGSPIEFDGDYDHPIPISKTPFFRYFANFIERSIPSNDDFGLTQIRFKGRLTSNFDFLIGGLTHFKTIEYHYRSSLL